MLVNCDGGPTSESWDAANRLVGILNPYNEQTTLQYDALDRESLKTLANGMQVSHLFDNGGREVLLSNLGPTGAALSMYTASYDAAGNRLSVVELDGTRVTFGYDRAYQLVNEQRSGANAYNTTYQYDTVGNRAAKNDSGQLTSYLYNAANELTLTTPPTGQPTTSSYDGNGNLAVENAGGALTSYSWDGENRLVGVAYPTTAPDTFSYSADGKRQKKVTAAGTVQFVWDEENVLLETDQNGLTQAHYTDYPGSWGGLASQRRSGVSSFYGFDLQANTRILATLLGVISDSYLYKAFGEELSVSGASINSRRYRAVVGYYRDIGTRQYAGVRYLSVDHGRWLGAVFGLQLAGINAYGDTIPGRARANTVRPVVGPPANQPCSPPPRGPAWLLGLGSCVNATNAYGGRFMNTGNQLDRCASCVSSFICYFAFWCRLGLANKVFGDDAQKTCNLLSKALLCQNACMARVWKERATPRWKHADQICGCRGENSWDCCAASVDAEQQDGYTPCAKKCDLVLALLPAWMRLKIAFNVVHCCGNATH